ncbi:uncharacterized protein LOC120418206 [Culex pipiens pallens]|uniref:uncharacterized protein LOC120418206 n=1 Tax=Culex pipiens pallens TaxID=42434 RepID=UPI001954A3B6|nr:uncharacterized protein LOC120418206 [Culex pipiens pallens]
MEQNFKCPLCTACFEKQDELKEHLGENHMESDVVLEFAAEHPDKPDSVGLIADSPIPVIIRTEPTPTSEFPAERNNGWNCGCLPCCSDGGRSAPVFAPEGCRECWRDCWQCCNICDDCECVIM